MAADLVVLAEGRHVGHGQAAVHLGGLVRGHPGVSVGRGVRGRGGSSPHAAPTATGMGACTAALPPPPPPPHPPTSSLPSLTGWDQRRLRKIIYDRHQSSLHKYVETMFILPVSRLQQAISIHCCCPAATPIPDKFTYCLIS